MRCSRDQIAPRHARGARSPSCGRRASTSCSIASVGLDTTELAHPRATAQQRRQVFLVDAPEQELHHGAADERRAERHDDERDEDLLSISPASSASSARMISIAPRAFKPKPTAAACRHSQPPGA